MYYKTDRDKRKEFEGVLAENKAKQKNEAWIRELEARDREDKEWKSKRDAVRAAAASGEGVGSARKALETSERKGEGRILDAVRDMIQGRR